MRLFYSFYLLFCYFVCSAQLPPPCPSNTTPPADICNQTCIYCNFNGIQSSTAGYTGQTPSGFCGTIENEQWAGFIAGETSATFTAIPSGCTNGDGIQIAVYPSCSGSPLSCYGGCGGCANVPTSTNVNNMVPGQNYYVMVDGFAGDQCWFTTVASPPSAIIPPFPPAPDSIRGKRQVCIGESVEYCVSVIAGAAAYTWVAPQGATINGLPSPATITGNSSGNCVTITFADKSGKVSVNGANSCFTGPPAVDSVFVKAQGQNIVFNDTTLCEDQVPYFMPWGDTVTASGTYTSFVGICDTVYSQTVDVKINPITQLPPINICGDSVLVFCGDTVTTGTTTITCTDAAGCDSILQFSTINIVALPTQPMLSGPTVVCPNDWIEFCATNVSNTDRLRWSNQVGWSLDGSGNVANIPTPNTCVDVVFSGTSGNLCVRAVNVCLTTPPTCLPITVEDVNFQLALPDTLTVSSYPTTLSAGNTTGSVTWYQNSLFNPIGSTSEIQISEDGWYLVEVNFPVSSGNCSVLDSVFVQLSTSTVEISKGEITIQPTISEGHFSVIAQGNTTFESLQIYGAEGKLYRTFDFEKTQQYELDLVDLPSGQYWVWVQTNAGVEVLKIVKL